MNLYTVIGMACVDEEFREALFEDHVSALQERGIVLSYPFEREELRSWTLKANRSKLEKAFQDFHHCFCPIRPCPPGGGGMGKRGRR